MAKKKKRKATAKRRGLVSTADLAKRIGPKGQQQARDLHQEGYSRDVLTFAARTMPKIPAKIERVIEGMSKSDQDKFRKACLKDALASKVPF